MISKPGSKPETKRAINSHASVKSGGFQIRSASGIGLLRGIPETQWTKAKAIPLNPQKLKLISPIQRFGSPSKANSPKEKFELV